MNRLCEPGRTRYTLGMIAAPEKRDFDRTHGNYSLAPDTAEWRAKLAEDLATIQPDRPIDEVTDKVMAIGDTLVWPPDDVKRAGRFFGEKAVAAMLALPAWPAGAVALCLESVSPEAKHKLQALRFYFGVFNAIDDIEDNAEPRNGEPSFMAQVGELACRQFLTDIGAQASLKERSTAPRYRSRLHDYMGNTERFPQPYFDLYPLLSAQREKGRAEPMIDVIRRSWYRTNFVQAFQREAADAGGNESLAHLIRSNPNGMPEAAQARNDYLNTMTVERVARGRTRFSDFKNGVYNIITIPALNEEEWVRDNAWCQPIDDEKEAKLWEILSRPDGILERVASKIKREAQRQYEVLPERLANRGRLDRDTQIIWGAHIRRRLESRISYPRETVDEPAARELLGAAKRKLLQMQAPEPPSGAGD